MIRLRPLHEEGKTPFDSAFPTRSQQPEENFSPTYKLIYQTLQKRFGDVYAQTWLKQQKGRPREDVELRTASSLLDTPQTHLELPQNPLPNALRSRISPFEGKIKPSTPPLPVAMPLKRFSELDPTLEAERRMNKLEGPSCTPAFGCCIGFCSSLPSSRLAVVVTCRVCAVPPFFALWKSSLLRLG